ncbi:hypothetical protein TCAL_16432, partial [Tigriopus californicus]
VLLLDRLWSAYLLLERDEEAQEGAAVDGRTLDWYGGSFGSLCVFPSGFGAKTEGELLNLLLPEEDKTTHMCPVDIGTKVNMAGHYSQVGMNSIMFHHCPALRAPFNQDWTISFRSAAQDVKTVKLMPLDNTSV